MTINIEYETEKKLDLDYETIIRQVVEKAMDYEKCPYEAEVNVTLTDNAAIHEINREYREIDRATDVLSFPMIEYETPADFDALEDVMDQFPEDYFNPDTGELMLGDIVISVEKVEEQAEKYGHSKERELAFLTAHSMMHLLSDCLYPLFVCIECIFNCFYITLPVPVIIPDKRIYVLHQPII